MASTSPPPVGLDHGASTNIILGFGRRRPAAAHRAARPDQWLDHGRNRCPHGRDRRIFRTRRVHRSAVQVLSQGMAARLAFAIASLALPGDSAHGRVDRQGTRRFRKRRSSGCSDSPIMPASSSSASHQNDLIARTCNKVLELEHGRVRRFCSIAEVSDGIMAPRRALHQPCHHHQLLLQCPAPLRLAAHRHEVMELRKLVLRHERREILQFTNRVDRAQHQVELDDRHLEILRQKQRSPVDLAAMIHIGEQVTLDLAADTARSSRQSARPRRSAASVRHCRAVRPCSSAARRGPVSAHPSPTA